MAIVHSPVILLSVILSVSHEVFCCIRTIDPMAEEGWSLEEQMSTQSVLMTSVMEMTTGELTSTVSASGTTEATSTTAGTESTTTTVPLGTCPTPMWKLNPAQNTCYMYVRTGGMTPEIRCDMYYSGAHAASIADEAENAFILAYLQDPMFAPYITEEFIPVYVGGVSVTPGMVGSPSWSWTDLSMYGPWENWNPTPSADPADMCMLISPFAGKWENGGCGFANDVLCEFPAV